MERMMTKRGSMVQVALCCDIGDNEGGYYCEVYREIGDDYEVEDDPYDYFVIHSEDIAGLQGEELGLKIRQLVIDYVSNINEY